MSCSPISSTSSLSSGPVAPAQSNIETGPLLAKMSCKGEDFLGEPDRNQSLDQYNDHSSLSSDDNAQAGVKTIEAVSQTWSKSSLIMAYIG